MTLTFLRENHFLKFKYSAYKIASVINERLKENIKAKLGEGQFGFSVGRETIDALYVLNYVTNREISKKEGNYSHALWISKQRLTE